MSQEFDKNVLDLAKQKRFHPYEFMSDSEKLKEELPCKESFYSLLAARIITDIDYEIALHVWNKFGMEMMK